MAETTNNAAQTAQEGAQANVQTTATSNATTTSNAAKGENSGADNTALFELLNKVIDQRADGLAKSTLKSNGVESDEEAKAIITAWKNSRTAAVQQTNDTLTAAQAENSQLKAQILQMQVTTVAQAQAAKMGIAAGNLPYITKLADFSDVMDDKGAPNEEKIAAALQKVLQDVPAFKQQADETKGFVKIGGDGGKDETTSEAENRLRKAFGLTSK